MSYLADAPWLKKVKQSHLCESEIVSDTLLNPSDGHAACMQKVLLPVAIVDILDAGSASQDRLTLEVVGSIGDGHAVAWLVHVVDGQALLVSTIPCSFILDIRPSHHSDVSQHCDCTISI